jgi:putative membrane protein
LARWFKSERKKDQEDLMQIEKERQLRLSENQV